MLHRWPDQTVNRRKVYHVILTSTLILIASTEASWPPSFDPMRRPKVKRDSSSQCIFKGIQLPQEDMKIPSYKDKELKKEDSYDYGNYNPIELINKELKRLESKYDDVFSLRKLGTSFEGRDIVAAQIKGRNTNKHSQPNRLIVVDCGVHAREWITHATCMFIIDKMVKGTQDSAKTMLNYFDWTIIPILNPDGYVYTWKGGNRVLWRKNRSRTKLQQNMRKEKNKELCIGVDINRNFGFHWGEVGAPATPCFEMYAGPAAFSEKESQALAEYLRSEKSRLAGYVSLHTFGQSWNTPYGFQKQEPKDHEEQMRVAKLAVEKIKATNNMTFTVGTSYEGIYPSSGSSTDWVYGKLKVVHSYLVEMMGCNTSHFHLPPENIVLNAEGILRSLGVMAREIHHYFDNQNG